MKKTSKKTLKKTTNISRIDRICLRCNGVFSSPGAHIRICGYCHNLANQYELDSQDRYTSGKHIWFQQLKTVNNTGKRMPKRLDEI